VRGPQVTPGYLNAAEETAAMRDEAGWMRTGDLAIHDADGFVSIVGRLKILIKYKGHQVAPAELEEILFRHPAVADAAVVGHPDQVAGELPKAYVVLNSVVPLEEIIAYVAERVSPHKKIRIIEQVSAIPRSETGKVQIAVPTSGRPPGPLRDLRVVITGGGKGLQDPGLDAADSGGGRFRLADSGCCRPSPAGEGRCGPPRRALPDSG
jgi:AMP-binding enzyme C-terminal domain/AMP-binding enzyme